MSGTRGRWVRTGHGSLQPKGVFLMSRVLRVIAPVAGALGVVLIALSLPSSSESAEAARSALLLRGGVLLLAIGLVGVVSHVLLSLGRLGRETEELRAQLTGHDQDEGEWAVAPPAGASPEEGDSWVAVAQFNAIDMGVAADMAVTRLRGSGIEAMRMPTGAITCAVMPGMPAVDWIRVLVPPREAARALEILAEEEEAPPSPDATI
jgi:hypothetical protein